jgi:hypothetical protein
MTIISFIVMNEMVMKDEALQEIFKENQSLQIE